MLKKRKAVWFFPFLLLCASTVFATGPEKLLVVLVPVADIRSEPKDRAPGYAHDDLNETQVLYNEILDYKGENADWYQVEALEQREFSHRKSWQGYPGWIRKDKACFIEDSPKYNVVVSSRNAGILNAPIESASVLVSVYLGTRFKEIGLQNGYYKVGLSASAFGWIAQDKITRIDNAFSEDAQRQNIVREANLFLGTPYLWGGRSVLGVDCSGLANLAYRACGIDLPRDAHEQWMLAKSISKEELKPADLIFLSKKDDFKTIGHVMLYLGKDDFIEAPGTGEIVHIKSLKDYAASGKKMYFGRILP